MWQSQARHTRTHTYVHAYVSTCMAFYVRKFRVSLYLQLVRSKTLTVLSLLTKVFWRVLSSSFLITLGLMDPGQCRKHKWDEVTLNFNSVSEVLLLFFLSWSNKSSAVVSRQIFCPCNSHIPKIDKVPESLRHRHNPCFCRNQTSINVVSPNVSFSAFTKKPWIWREWNRSQLQGAQVNWDKLSLYLEEKAVQEDWIFF